MTVAENSIRNLINENEIVIDEIKKGDGGEVDVFSAWNQEIRMVYEVDDFSVATSQNGGSYGIRYLKGGQLGFTNTNSNSLESLRGAAREVQQIARLSTPSEFNGIADRPNVVGHFESIDLKLQALTPSQLGEFADDLIDIAKSDKRVLIDRAEMRWSYSFWTLSNSNGFSQSAASTTCSWFVMGMAKQNDEVTSFDYDGGTVNKLSEIETQMIRTVSSFKESVIGSLGPKKISSYKGIVMLHPQAVMDLIVDFVATNCSALRQQDGMSAWKDQLGKAVAHPSLNVREDPLNANRIDGWMPFDREGVPTNFHTLVDKGHLAFVGHNCFSAKRAGCDPTGNASGSTRSLPGIGFSNLMVAASGQSPECKTDEELFSSVKQGLLLKRFSGNCDPTSGQFSGVAKNSVWFQDGRPSHPVHEVMVAGNVFDLLKSIVGIGKHTHSVYGGGVAPYILIDGLSVTSS